MTSALGTVAVEELRDGLLGDLIERGHPGYAEARAIWNGHIERQPALIARCRGVADVIATVRFAANATCSSRCAVVVMRLPGMPCVTTGS